MLRNDPSVISFASAARDYVELVGSPPTDGGEFAEDLFRVVSRLSTTVIALPDVAPDATPDEVELAVGDDEWRRIYELSGTLPFSQYYDVSDATGDIADDVADIYRDLKPGLLALDRNDARLVSGAVWTWRTSYESHWRQHLDGLRAALLPQVRRRGWRGVALANGEEEFLANVLARHPTWNELVHRVPSAQPATWTTMIDVPSPTGDPERTVAIWLEDGDPSIGFGSWHTHAESMAAFWDCLEAILGDQLVLARDIGGQFDSFEDLLDLRGEDAALERLTNQYAAPRIRLRSFTGARDRELP